MVIAPGKTDCQTMMTMAWRVGDSYPASPEHSNIEVLGHLVYII